MTRTRRRTRTGLPVAILIAVLTAVFASRGPRGPGATPPSGANPPVATATTPTPSREASGSTGAAGPRAAPVGATTRETASPGFASRQRLVEHFEKHGAEFPGYGIDAYLRAAQSLRDAPVGGAVLELRRRDGVVTRFDRESGAFLAVNRDRTIRTYFRPNDGEAYFRRQASRTPGGGA